MDINDVDVAIFKKCLQSKHIIYQELLDQNAKLAFVKQLKEDSGYGLRECKEYADSIWEKKIKINNIPEERRKKLEKLAKKPLVENIIESLKDKDEDSLSSILMNMNIDFLLELDEKLNENNNSVT